MPRKKWFSTEDVIAKVQPHDVLYTKTNKDHKLNQLANQIWSNITKELFEEAGLTWNNLSPKLQDTKIQQVKTRWKSIKDNFRRELLEEKKESRSGSAASNRTKYSYTTELAFLRPSMDLDETQDNIPAEPVVPIVDDDAEEGLDNSTLSLLSTSDTPSDDTSNTSSVNVFSLVQPTTSTTKTTTTKVTARGRRQGGGGRSQSSFESGVLNSMQEAVGVLHHASCDHYNFAVSLVPYMKKVPEDRILDLRQAIIDLVKKAIKNTPSASLEHSQSSSSSSTPSPSPPVSNAPYHRQQPYSNLHYHHSYYQPELDYGYHNYPCRPPSNMGYVHPYQGQNSNMEQTQDQVFYADIGQTRPQQQTENAAAKPTSFLEMMRREDN
ncbi:uncharacterized protein [Hyperolius riggenbachi]|uniref:uncharacterized protein n=1 Tax=Hyperolius riggenbachi TaxID=752182 RepID=UPI0035A342AC